VPGRGWEPGGAEAKGYFSRRCGVSASKRVRPRGKSREVPGKEG